MKILFVINTLNIGGAERLVTDLSIVLKKKGYEPVIYVLKKSSHNALLNDLNNNNIQVNFSSRKSFYDIRHIFDLMGIVIKEEFNIVHSNLSFAFYYCAILTYLSRKKSIYSLVYTEHSTSNRRRKNLFFKFFDSVMYHKYSKIICISNDTELMLNNWLSSTKKKTITINNGIVISKFRNAIAENLRKKYHLTNNDKVILSVGSLTEHKNHKLLLKALLLLNDEYKVFLAGQGPLDIFLKGLSKELKIQDQVFFLGVRSDIELLYKSADLFVLASIREGFGLVAAEAMAAGIPVLVSDIPGLSKIVGDGGFTFKSENSQDLADKIQYIFQNPGEVDKKVNIASERVMDYSIEVMSNQYISVYMNVTVNNS